MGPEHSGEGADDSKNWALFAQAQQLAYADRDKFVADDTFVDVPIKGLTDSKFLQDRAALINKQAPIEIEAGNPFNYQMSEAAAFGQDATKDVAGTTHFVVVDKEGNVVSMTASVESIFGSSRMAGGMFLNNQLTDFSFKYQDESGQPIANRVEAGKRPRSSMSPTTTPRKSKSREDPTRHLTSRH